MSSLLCCSPRKSLQERNLTAISSAILGKQEELKLLLNNCYFLGVDRSNHLSPFSLFLNTVGAILELFTQTVTFPPECCGARKVPPSVFTREQMAAVKEKKKKAERKRGKEKPFQPILSLKSVIWDLLFFLSFPPPLFKAGVKFRGRNLGLQGVGDPDPGSIWAVVSVQLVSVTGDCRGEEQDRQSHYSVRWLLWTLQSVGHTPKYQCGSKRQTDCKVSSFGLSPGTHREKEHVINKFMYSEEPHAKPQHTLSWPQWNIHS